MIVIQNLTDAKQVCTWAPNAPVLQEMGEKLFGYQEFAEWLLHYAHRPVIMGQDIEQGLFRVVLERRRTAPSNTAQDQPQSEIQSETPTATRDVVQDPIQGNVAP